MILDHIVVFLVIILYHTDCAIRYRTIQYDVRLYCAMSCNGVPVQVLAVWGCGALIWEVSRVDFGTRGKVFGRVPELITCHVSS